MSTRDDAGAATLWVLAACVVLLAVSGLGADLWRVVGARAEASAVADAVAAAAGAQVDGISLYDGAAPRLDAARARRVAAEVHALHPLRHEADRLTLDVGATRVVVRLERPFRFGLLALLGAPDTTLLVTAAADVRER